MKSAHAARIKSTRLMFGTSIPYWKLSNVESVTSFIQMESSQKMRMVTTNIVRDIFYLICGSKLKESSFYIL